MPGCFKNNQGFLHEEKKIPTLSRMINDHSQVLHVHMTKSSSMKLLGWNQAERPVRFSVKSPKVLGFFREYGLGSVLLGKGGLVITGNFNLGNTLSEQMSRSSLVTSAVQGSKTREGSS